MIVPVLREVSTVERKMRVSGKLMLISCCIIFRKPLDKLNGTNVEYFKRLTSWHNLETSVNVSN